MDMQQPEATDDGHPTGEGISMAPPGFDPELPKKVADKYEGLPRKIVKTVTVSVSLVEEQPTEVSVVPVGQMSRQTASGLALAALGEAGFYNVHLDSNGFSEHGAFFGVRLPEPKPDPKAVTRFDCICHYNTNRPPGQYTRTDIHRNPKCPVDHSS